MESLTHIGFSLVFRFRTVEHRGVFPRAGGSYVYLARMVDRCGRRYRGKTRVCRSMPSCFQVRQVEFRSRDTPPTRRRSFTTGTEDERERSRITSVIVVKLGIVAALVA